MHFPFLHFSSLTRGHFKIHNPYSIHTERYTEMSLFRKCMYAINFSHVWKKISCSDATYWKTNLSNITLWNPTSLYRRGAEEFLACPTSKLSEFILKSWLDRELPSTPSYVYSSIPEIFYALRTLVIITLHKFLFNIYELPCLFRKDNGVVFCCLCHSFDAIIFLLFDWLI